MFDLDDLDEQVEFLTYLSKSSNSALAEQAREALDRLATVQVVKVGPHGFVHGWVFVGEHGSGDRVEHPELGHGTVSHHKDGQTHVRFDSGAEHSFERHASSVSAQRGHQMENAERMERGKPALPASGPAFRKQTSPPPLSPAAERGRQLEELDRQEREDRRRYSHKSMNSDLDEQVEYLTYLSKSSNPALADQAREALDRLITVDIVKVGPKGYIHGWIHVGTPAAGVRVMHPEHGHGTVIGHEGGTDHMRADGAGFSHRAEGGRVHVRFDSGATHSFEHTGDIRPKPGADFRARNPVEARGRNLTQERAETERIGRQAHGEGEFNAAIRQATAANAKKPVTDKEFVARANAVEKAIGEARKTHSTDITHMTDGKWNPDRVRQHKEIVDKLYAEHAHVPNEGKAVIAGGLGGAGKTTVLKGHAGIDPKQWLTVNPDDIKEEMAKRGMVPDVPGHPELSPMERSALVHEESSHIAQMLADKAYRDKKNMIWDITMSSGGSVKKRIDALHQNGYNNVRGVFVHIPAETSVERAMARYRRGVDDFRAGEGLGGRYVPPSVIRAQKTSDGSTINRGVFDGLKSSFDDWSVYDNSGKAPTHVESKG